MSRPILSGEDPNRFLNAKSKRMRKRMSPATKSTTENKDQLLDVAGAADVADCPPQWIRRAVYAGEIKILTGSKRLLIPLSEIFQ